MSQNILECGKLYEIKTEKLDITIHYFCLLFAYNGSQKGTDEQGLFGFLVPDIMEQIAKASKQQCYYCGEKGALSR